MTFSVPSPGVPFCDLHRITDFCSRIPENFACGRLLGPGALCAALEEGSVGVCRVLQEFRGFFQAIYHYSGGPGTSFCQELVKQRILLSPKQLPN